MVSGLERHARDPEFPRKNRGPGWYYSRGKLNGSRRKTWSKYSEGMDKKRPHLPWKVKDIDAKEKTQPHKGDYKTIGIKPSRASSVPESRKVKVTDPRRPGYIRKRKFPRQKARSESRKGYF